MLRNAICNRGCRSLFGLLVSISIHLFVYRSLVANSKNLSGAVAVPDRQSLTVYLLATVKSPLVLRSRRDASTATIIVATPKKKSQSIPVRPMAATITPALAALSSVKKVDDDSNDHYIDLDAVKASVGSAGSVVHEADTISSTPAFFAQKLFQRLERQRFTENIPLNLIAMMAP